MSFVAGVRKFTFAVMRNRKELSFVTCSDVESAIGRKREVPDVFGFGIEENGLLAGRRDTVDLAIGRSADVQNAFGVKGDGLGGEVGRIKNYVGFAARIETKDFRRRTTRRVQSTLGINAQGPKIGSVCVCKQR